MKYDYNYHYNVVRNHRQYYKDKYGPQGLELVTDEEIWKLHEQNAMLDDPDIATMEDILQLVFDREEAINPQQPPPIHKKQP